MALMPAMVDAKMPDGKFQKIQALLTKTAQCIRCGNVWTFEHNLVNPEAPAGEGAAPAPEVPAEPAPSTDSQPAAG